MTGGSVMISDTGADSIFTVTGRLHNNYRDRGGQFGEWVLILIPLYHRENWEHQEIWTPRIVEMWRAATGYQEKNKSVVITTNKNYKCLTKSINLLRLPAWVLTLCRVKEPRLVSVRGWDNELWAGGVMESRVTRHTHSTPARDKHKQNSFYQSDAFRQLEEQLKRRSF